MFIDWLTLLLVNMMVALVLHSLFMGFWIDKDPKKVIPGFLLTGAIALIAGFRMAFTWPLPGAYNIIYGELSVLLGAFFFMAGLSIHFGWNLLTIGIYSLFGGAVAVLMGVRIWVSGMTSEPFVAGLGFVVTGATAVLTLPGLALPKMKWIRWLAALGAIGSAVIWILVGFPAYWGHIDAFGKWLPPTIPPAPPK
jgi:putative membrane protein